MAITYIENPFNRKKGSKADEVRSRKDKLSHQTPTELRAWSCVRLGLVKLPAQKKKCVTM